MELKSCFGGFTDLFTVLLCWKNIMEDEVDVCRLGVF